MERANQHFADDIKTYLSINDILQIRIPDDPNSPTYYSRINDISEGRLIVAWPTHNAIRLLVHRDQILDFYFMQGNVPHEFAGLVDETSDGPLPQLRIILSSAVTRIQRRQNFRIKALIPTEIAGQMTDPKDGSVKPVVLRTTTCDLSASGLAILNAKSIPENTLVEAKLFLPDDDPFIRIPCRVVYSTSPAENHAVYRTGLRYLAIGESERARIVRYVYRSQLKGLRP